MLDPRQQFRVLYRDFLLRMVDVEVLAAGGDVQRLLGQFGALLAAFSFVVAIYIIPPYVSTTLRPDQIALAAWGDQEFPDPAHSLSTPAI
ncbi:MAG: hypothetical protein ABSB35_30910 [Bryobacteraceae bacterium]|jgi:hypothetical protein